MYPKPWKNSMNPSQKQNQKTLSEEDFIQIISQFQQELYRFFLFLGNSPEDSEDLVQETFIRFYHKFHLYKEQGSLRAYLYHLAKNLWIDLIQRKKRPLSHDLKNLEQKENLFLYHDHQKDLKLDLQWALWNLEEKFRLPLILKFYQNFKYDEISMILDIPVGTIKNRVFKGVQKLRSLLSAYQERERK
ncbi:MAG: RNA polymerase sigma factor [Planctomycetota bacterium]|nr:MAG: RNA polymerase sigma factor [Planctomycetota bacterium]